MKPISPQVFADEQLDLSEAAVDRIAWGFLGSEFTTLIYASWPIERRVDGYLTRHDMVNVLNNGDAHTAVVQRVLANTGVALRDGVLPTTTWETSRRDPRTAMRGGPHE
ncbi:hypothetical protein ACGFK1_28290 [Mycobacterium sp. NPDC048908]|uniref:hypothetical protein n=1 Tax=Mycobacterium sp. NPDC048908 TaxID=3364292 RepID=UPI0037103033